MRCTCIDSDINIFAREKYRDMSNQLLKISLISFFRIGIRDTIIDAVLKIFDYSNNTIKSLSLKELFPTI